jgi:hypothetical protein
MKSGFNKPKATFKVLASKMKDIVEKLLFSGEKIKYRMLTNS